jgi:hypothetical protein
MIQLNDKLLERLVDVIQSENQETAYRGAARLHALVEIFCHPRSTEPCPVRFVRHEELGSCLENDDSHSQ